MSATETGRPGTVPGGPTATAEAQLDPTLSPAQTHEPPPTSSPVPRVLISRPRTAGPPAPERPSRPVEKSSGVRLAKISQTGDRVFRSFAGGSGVLIVVLVLFV